jgi:hypothetical protein
MKRAKSRGSGLGLLHLFSLLHRERAGLARVF